MVTAANVMRDSSADFFFTEIVRDGFSARLKAEKSE